MTRDEYNHYVKEDENFYKVFFSEVFSKSLTTWIEDEFGSCESDNPTLRIKIEREIKAEIEDLDGTN